jgi:hypothetical protein
MCHEGTHNTALCRKYIAKCMEQSPSEVDNYLADEEIPRFL